MMKTIIYLFIISFSSYTFPTEINNFDVYEDKRLFINYYLACSYQGQSFAQLKEDRFQEIVRRQKEAREKYEEAKEEFKRDQEQKLLTWLNQPMREELTGTSAN